MVSPLFIKSANRGRKTFRIVKRPRSVNRYYIKIADVIYGWFLLHIMMFQKTKRTPSLMILFSHKSLLLIYENSHCDLMSLKKTVAI